MHASPALLWKLSVNSGWFPLQHFSCVVRSHATLLNIHMLLQFLLSKFTNHKELFSLSPFVGGTRWQPRVSHVAALYAALCSLHERFSETYSVLFAEKKLEYNHAEFIIWLRSNFGTTFYNSCFDRLAVSISCCTNNVVFFCPVNATSLSRGLSYAQPETCCKL